MEVEARDPVAAPVTGSPAVAFARTGADATAAYAEQSKAGMTQRLELEELASEAETTVERIRRLIAIGAIVAAADGSFTRGDVIRSRVVNAFEAEGFSLDQMEVAIRERAVALDSLHLFYPDPSPRTGRK